MKKHHIQIITSDSFLVNGVSEKSPLEEALGKHGVGRGEVITLILSDDISLIKLTYEIYQHLKDLGFSNIDFSGSGFVNSVDKQKVNSRFSSVI